MCTGWTGCEAVAVRWEQKMASVVGGGAHIHPICLHRCSFTSTFIFTEHVLLYIFNRLLDTCYLCTVLYMPKKDQNTPTLQLQYLPLYKNTVLYLVSISLRCSKLIVRSLCHKHRGEHRTPRKQTPRCS